MGHDRLIACPRNEEAALSGTERRVVNINLPRTRNLGTGWDECSNSSLGHLASCGRSPDKAHTGQEVERSRISQRAQIK